MTSPDEAAGPPGERGDLPLFAYGTLTFGEIVMALLGRDLPATRAVLAGWRAARLPRRPYPGLVPATGSSTGGLLLWGLSPTEWATLDDWEGDPYLLRTVVTVAAEPTGPAVTAVPATTGALTALTYVWRNLDDIRADNWDPAWFAAGWLDRYVRRLAAARSS
jgi:hypothetical protein